MSDIQKYDYGKLDKITTLQREVAKIKTVEKAIELRKELPTLVTIKKEKGEEKARAYIELIILKLNDFFNVKEKMNKEQIEETASIILEEYYWMSIIEVLFVFKEARVGRYGEIKYAIDGGMILKWFEKYTTERTATIERENESERMRNNIGNSASDRISTDQNKMYKIKDIRNGKK